MNPQQAKWLIVAGLAFCVMLLFNLLSVAPAQVVAGNLRQVTTNTPTPTPTPTTLTYHSINFDGVVNATDEWKGSIEKLGAASGVQYYLTWDETYLYAAMLGGTTSTNNYNLLIDTDPFRAGSSNTGTQNEFCGATFGVNAKPNYAIQKQWGNRPTGLWRASGTETPTPTPTACGFDGCRSESLSREIFTQTPESGRRPRESSQPMQPQAEAWSTWTPPSGQTSSRGSTNQVEFRVRWSDIGLTSRTQALGVYLYTCSASSRVISAWPPSNLQSTGNVQEMNSHAYFPSTDGGRAPRAYAQQWGEQTVLTPTGNLSLLNGFAQFNLTAGGGAGCTLSVHTHGNAAADRDNSAVRRLYDITPSNCPGLTADLTLKYLDGTEYEAVDELNGAIEANLLLFRWDGSAWNDEGGTGNTSNNSVTRNGVSTFSPWTFDDASPTAIILTNLDAQSPILEPTMFLLLGSMVLIGAGVAIWKRRRA